MTAWNPPNSQLSTSDSHHSTTKYWCSVASPLTFASKYSADSEELVNFVQRHTKFSKSIFGYVHEFATCNADCGILKFIICQIFIPQSPFAACGLRNFWLMHTKYLRIPYFAGCRMTKLSKFVFACSHNKNHKIKTG